MAGVATPNLAPWYMAGMRGGEVPNADWIGGVNWGGSNAVGIGINTGDYSPKDSDWSEDARTPQNSQIIAEETGGPISMIRNGVDDDEPHFVQADGDIAPDGELVAASGVINRTGKTVPTGAWVWGTKASS